MSVDREFLSRFLTEGEQPVFAQPWEARAFALAVQLHADGHFTWPEFSQSLSEVIADSCEDSYYRDWLRALERILHQKRIVNSQEISTVIATIHSSLPHGDSH